MKIEVVYSIWGVGDDVAGDAQVFNGGVQDVRVVESSAEYKNAGGRDASPRAIEARYLAAGEAAGTIVIVEATDAETAQLEGHVESQEDSEAAYEAAVEAGTWHEGNLQQFVTQTEERLSLSDEEANLTPGDRHWLTEGLAVAHDTLGNTDAAKAVREGLANADGDVIAPDYVAPTNVEQATEVLSAPYGMTVAEQAAADRAEAEDASDEDEDGEV